MVGTPPRNARGDAAGALASRASPEAADDTSFRELVERSTDGIGVHRDRVVIYANRAMAQLLGYDSPDELLGLSSIALVHPDDHGLIAPRMAVLAAGGQNPPIEERLVRKDGSTVIASVSTVAVTFRGAPAVAVTVRDVTEQRRLQTRLAHADRMRSLGALAAGVAHEINNPLTYVMLRLGAIGAVGRRLRTSVLRLQTTLTERLGHAEATSTIGADLSSGLAEELASHVETASEGAARVRRIVNDLRVFSRNDEEAREPIDLERPLELALSMATHELKHRATVVRAYTPVPPVLGSESRLAQVFLNLLLNAAQAIPEGRPTEQRITLRTGTEGHQVFATVEDTGKGIAPEHLSRLFEPFFTTDDTEASGLGLAICHGILSSLGGSIRVESTPGRGSTFTVLLPRAPRPSHPIDLDTTA